MTKIPTILFEDQHLAVVSKPAGLLSQGDHSNEHCLVDWMREHVGRHYVGLIHRLDRNTSGLMIIAKRSKAANRLTEALQSGKIYRSYLAWVSGALSTKVTWTHFLKKDERANKVTVVRSRSILGAQSATLTATPMERALLQGEDVTLVKFELETGRSHQIRVQSAHEGYPLLGDTKYGRGHPAVPRIALHSFQLSFPHPMSGEEMKFEEGLPEDLRNLPLRKISKQGRI